MHICNLCKSFKWFHFSYFLSHCCCWSCPSSSLASCWYGLFLFLFLNMFAFLDIIMFFMNASRGLDGPEINQKITLSWMSVRAVKFWAFFFKSASLMNVKAIVSISTVGEVLALNYVKKIEKSDWVSKFFF